MGRSDEEEMNIDVGKKGWLCPTDTTTLVSHDSCNILKGQNMNMIMDSH